MMNALLWYNLIMADKITWSNERRKLSDLIPWDINPAQINKKQAERLEESLELFGQIQTLAISPTNEIYDGHQRQLVWGASQKYGGDYEVDVRVASRELTEQERKKLIIYLRKGAVGEFDFDILANNFEVDDLLDWGFDAKELDLTLWDNDDPLDDPGAQIDKAEELREKWGVKLGQLWQLGEHRLICGDCTDESVVERVMGETPDAIITDPPYGISAVSNSGVLSKRYKNDLIGDDSVDVAGVAFVMCKEYECPQVWWGANYYADVTGASPCWFVWDKNNGASDQADAELAWTNLQGVVRLFKQASEKAGRLHPTQKHPDLIEWCILRCGEVGIVYDPFLGSGTTMVAAHRLGRRCFGVEISPAYCAVAIQRWVDMTGEEPVLLGNSSD
jgi:hypothetical protein